MDALNTNQESIMKTAEAMPTRVQFDTLNQRLIKNGWALSHTIMASDADDLRFGSCFIKSGSTVYVNYLTVELINIMLDSQA